MAPAAPVLDYDLLVQLLHYQLLPPVGEDVQVLPGDVELVQVLELGQTGQGWLDIIFKSNSCQIFPNIHGSCFSLADCLHCTAPAQPALYGDGTLEQSRNVRKIQACRR